MSAVSPKEIEEVINKITSKDIHIDEVIASFEDLGIQVKNPDGSFICMDDILRAMSETWNKLNDK